tara:strand:- start:61 stop:714 length:654 start_codon:yes stop_codon:yes gene_type:complete
MSQIKSKKRVADHGEVFTSTKEINAMLDMIKQETENIESTFLEPTCGSGNFLSEILIRKLNVVRSRYKKNQLEYERYSFIAVSSIYGIELLEDNVKECRANLFNVFNNQYKSLFKKNCKNELRNSIKFILEKNIICGDALTLKTLDEVPIPITFSQWSSLGRSQIKRKDFSYKSMIDQSSLSELPLFSDLGEEQYIPTPTKDYPPLHFLNISDVESS